MRRIPILPLILAVIVVVTFVAAWAGIGFGPLRSKNPPIMLRRDMFYQRKVNPQQPSTLFADGASMRPAVPGAVPREGGVYPYTTWQQADSALVNPIPVATAEMLARGQNRFNAFCAPCHSWSGQDTTEVVRRGMQKPPNLLQNAPRYSDAHIFHIISAGQNIMPGYADKLRSADRWRVIAWVRELQKAPLKYPLPSSASTPSASTPSASTPSASTPSASTPSASTPRPSTSRVNAERPSPASGRSRKP